MKTYQKLPIPKDTAWERKTWKRHVHWRIKEFLRGIDNLIDWFSTIWKDRHWDDYYITKVIQRKIELQREYLVNANRNTGIPNDNFWMTVVLNLLEREHTEMYGLEMHDYFKEHVEFIPVPDRPGSKEIEFILIWEKFDDYLAKYPNTVKRVKKLYPNRDFTDRRRLCSLVANYNQKRCRNLIFEILKNKSHGWWD